MLIRMPFLQAAEESAWTNWKHLSMGAFHDVIFLITLAAIAYLWRPQANQNEDGQLTALLLADANYYHGHDEEGDHTNNNTNMSQSSSKSWLMRIMGFG